MYVLIQENVTNNFKYTIITIKQICAIISQILNKDYPTHHFRWIQIHEFHMKWVRKYIFATFYLRSRERIIIKLTFHEVSELCERWECLALRLWRQQSLRRGRVPQDNSLKTTDLLYGMRAPYCPRVPPLSDSHSP